MAPVRASEAGTPATRSSTRRAPSTAARAGSVVPTPVATPSAGGKALVKPQPKTKTERPGWGVGAKKVETTRKADGSSSSLAVRPGPTTTASSSTLASVATPKHSSMASKFLNAANSVRKIAQPALSRLHQVTGAPGPQSGDKESIKAYLRIRPTPPGTLAATTEPYLVMSHDTEVIMTAPSDPTRPNSFLKPSQAYTFTKIFAPETPQPEFFKATALPLVQSLLNGENGLVFAYGVTNSGKSYTIQGGADADGSGEERGVIPRAIDVVFNSVEDRQTEVNIRPTFLSSVEIVNEAEEGYTGRPSFLSRAGRANGSSTPTGEERDPTVLPVDKNYSYAVFVSYCEVYNEKIFDLLDNSTTGPASSSTYTSTQPSSGIPRAISQLPRSSLHPDHSASGFGSSHTLSGLGQGGVKRKALTLKNDADASGKYVAGLKEIRVWSREEAQAVVAMGQINRQVFGTLANSVSSRSHGVFTIKIVRVHNGAPDDVQSMQSSRLSIVDLAGSERTKNTGNTGERLKEAGNINKSLMVLGQCMEVLQSNQRRAGFGRKPAMVPFRHSKLTEMFQNYFIGDGRAVMMIHVNPFDTGFDENSHVMRFSAVARDIFTTTHTPAKFVARRPELPPSNLSEAPTATSAAASTARPAIPQEMLKAGVPSSTSAETVVVHAPAGEKAADSGAGDVAMSAVAGAVSPRESEIERVEVEQELMASVEEEEDESEDDEPDALVEHLFDVVKELRMKVFELELRCGTIETETREELSRQFDTRERDLERQHMERLIAANERSEVLKAKQIDIVQRSVRKPQPARTTRFATPESDEDEDDEEADEDEEEDDDDEVDKSLIAGSEDSSFDTDASASEPPSPSPATHVVDELRGEPVKSVSKALASLAVESSDADETDTGDATETTVLYVEGEVSLTEESEDDDEQDEGEDESEESEDEEDEDESFDASVAASEEPSSAESTPVRTTRRKSSMAARKSTTASPTKKTVDKPALVAGHNVRRSLVADENVPEADDQDVENENDEDEDPMMLEAAPSSTAGSAKKAALKESMSQAEAREEVASPSSEVTSPIVKKKKRKLGGAKRVLTEEEILQFQDQSLRGGAVPRLVKGGF